ncbi:hypothetical protein CHL67_04280 [Prosthecochloris sp. GSB1]|uniref:hypothetical protein n=1 Tax=Prosthecochloris sp. GSB1 TaxID=281093 RepID=UPI000B8CEC9F|nr:hypothetical protein [Prosthecochloris sp. GSB1]ASQ90241.1 hypothetical protein CHL67_04280 [Prosthecochloris sp. GSB1]
MNAVALKKMLTTTILGLLLQGCSATSTLKLDPQTLDNQHKVLQDGVEAIISTKKALVAVRPGAETYSSQGRPTIVVTVLNGAEEPFDFSSDDVRVLVDGKPHKVFSCNELVAEAERLREGATIAAALQATMLKKTTVLPRAWHGGHVTIGKIPDVYHPSALTVIVRAADEEHEFLFMHFRVLQ